MKHINTFKEKMLNENKSGYIIGSDPLDATLKLKEKLLVLMNELENFEDTIMEEFNSDSEDYSDEVYTITSKIKQIGQSMDLDDLEITLSDFNIKNKKE